MKRNKAITDFFESKQNKRDEAATQALPGLLQESMKEEIDFNNDSDTTEADMSTSSTCAAIIHCSSECCMDFSRSFQPDNRAVLEGTKKVQGTGSSQRIRSVQWCWFKEFNWLTLCETQGKLFCTQCRFCTVKGLNLTKKNEGAFTVVGFQNWKHAITSFKKHEETQFHQEATAQMQIYMLHQPSVDAPLVSPPKVKQKYNQAMLIKQLTSLRFLIAQGLAIEGHNSESGNLHQLMQLRAEDCPDLSRWVSEKEYMSPDVINELIHLFAKDILQRLLSKMHEVGFYSLLVDETRDIENKELITLFRWVDTNYAIHEDFIGLIDLPKTNSSTIYRLLNDILIHCNMPLSLCRGQAYDGAANLSGHIPGVAAQFKQMNPAAIHVHCLAHCINLRLQDVGRNCKAVRDALNMVLEVTYLIKQSPKHTNLFTSLKRELSPESQNLHTLCPTRWIVCTSAMKSIIDNYRVLYNTMTQINEESDDEYGRRACGILAILEKFSTFYGLHLSHLVFSATERLSKTLQVANTTLQDAQKAVKLTQEFLLRQRSEHACKGFYRLVTYAAQDLTDPPVLPRHQRLSERLNGGDDTFPSPAEYYKGQYYEVLDLLACELAHLFNQKDTDVAIDLEKLLLSAAKGEKVSFAPTTLELYASDFNFDHLRTQLKMLPYMIKASGNKPAMMTTIRSISDAMNAVPVAKTFLPEVHKLLCLYYTIPVTTATAERSLSMLRRVKNYLRSTMAQMRFNDLMCAYSHKETLAQTDIPAIAAGLNLHKDGITEGLYL